MCALNTKKLCKFNLAASLITTAVPGAVVSNPIPRKMTFLVLFLIAISNASRPEKTIRTSAPFASSFSSEESEPGTRIRSPNVAIMVSGIFE